MTISSTTRIAGPFLSGTALPFTFKVFAAADLEVVRLNTSTGVETTLVLGSDYTVALNGNQNTNPGGTVNLTVAASATSTVTITSDIANLQPTDLTNQGGFYPEVITDALDRATIQIQQMSEDVGRSLKGPISDGSLNMELPTAAQRANSFLAFDANGVPTAVVSGSSGAPTTITRQVFSGTGSQTVFTLASDPGALGNSAQVYIGGVYQQRSTYTIAGTTLTFSQAPVAGTDNIEFVNFLTSNIGATSADLVTYTPSGVGAVARSAASKFGETISVKDFGAVGDSVTDDTAAINAAIAYAASTINGAAGMEVFFPTGTYLISSKINMPNRVTLRGANGRGVVIKPHSSFADSYMFHASNGTSAMFGSMLRDMYIDARGKNMTAVVWAQAWQETSGMDRVVVQFDGTTAYGVLITDGYGGAAFTSITNCEIFSDSTNANCAGIQVNQISLVGGFVVVVHNCTITGSASNQLQYGIRLANDSCEITAYHGEYVNNMLSCAGLGTISAEAFTGSANNVVNLITFEASFAGKVSVRGMVPNGATGQTINDDATGRDIAASEGRINTYTYGDPFVSAYVSAQIPNVTGNATEYTVVFDTEIADYTSNYNAATGVFTAPRTGKYLVATTMKVAVPSVITTYVVKIVTSNRTYHVFRGDTDNVRDGSSTFTCSGTVVADLDVSDTARINIIVSGVGSDTVDVEADETSLQIAYLGR